MSIESPDPGEYQDKMMLEFKPDQKGAFQFPKAQKGLQNTLDSNNYRSVGAI